MSHAKRNTSRAVFTSHERAMAKAAWSSASARLTRESFLAFASCALCLEPAQDPVACAAAGDVYCRECALSNILAQKKELARAARAREAEAQARLEQQAAEDAEAERRAVQAFALAEAGLSTKRALETDPDADPDADNDGTRPKKTKLADELARVADADRQRARRDMEAEKAAAADAKTMPSFWTPSETPSAAKVVATAVPDEPRCPAGDGHAYGLHSLVSVVFARGPDGAELVCPACSKGLSNASRAVLAKPCGHVLCRGCVDKFVRAAADPHAEDRGLRCYVCEASLEDEEKDKSKKGKKKEKKKDKKNKIRPGLVDLRSEGTGFSAGGASEVKKSSIAFQC